MMPFHPELSLDSFLVCFAIAPFVPDWRTRRAMLALLGTLDGLASLVAGDALRVAVFLTALLGAVVPLSVRLPVSRKRFALLPLLLCLDNLATHIPGGEAF